MAVAIIPQADAVRFDASLLPDSMGTQISSFTHENGDLVITHPDITQAIAESAIRSQEDHDAILADRRNALVEELWVAIRDKAESYMVKEDQMALIDFEANGRVRSDGTDESFTATGLSMMRQLRVWREQIWEHYYIEKAKILNGDDVDITAAAEAMPAVPYTWQHFFNEDGTLK